MAKAIKQYNYAPRPRPATKYSEIYTVLVRPITPPGFQREKNFFIFTDGAKQETKSYTDGEKREWFQHLKTYYTRVQTPLGRDHLVNFIRSNFDLELRGILVDQWMQKKGIEFEPSASYFQEQNRASEQKNKTFIEQVKVLLLEELYRTTFGQKYYWP